ncbi:MAG: ribosome assembly cofactor RimP [Culturomica sp.]|nr:ribosome assembly cofactor RimP [Culturomica sp.]
MQNITGIRKIVEQLTEGTELFLVELKLSKENVIQVFIDSPTGVDIDTCGTFSRALEERLNRDEEDFELTVSSAGIGYPFKVPGQYLKNRGKRVSVQTTDGTVREGILLSWSETGIVLECEEKRAAEGKKKKETVKVTVALSPEEVKEIRDVVSFK